MGQKKYMKEAKACIQDAQRTPRKINIKINNTKGYHTAGKTTKRESLSHLLDMKQTLRNLEKLYNTMFL